MAKNRRHLVEIWPNLHNQLQAVMRARRKLNMPIASIPLMVNDALERAMPETLAKYMPNQTHNPSKE